MRIYAERSVVIVRQVAADLVVLLWTYVWIRAAFWLHDLVGRLAAPGLQLEKFGGSLADSLRDAGSRIDGLPLVGGGVAEPLARAADAARAAAGAGSREQDFVHDLAVLLPVLLLIVPIGLVLLGWLPARIRGVRRRATARSLRESAAGRDLLALRALATRPLRELSELSPDIAGAWRRGDAAAVEGLVALELRGAGLKSREHRIVPPVAEAAAVHNRW
ncbi:hypothetical protein DMB66_55575 [Actinoplanes sp. ATCC 53533]|uniref:hypothetical protein n=1 Tax=Actinoplanes sp. ATCC 53533 TaxID=1288362 RepID=UPI000F799492|nr:hypothetical protein [Actinoplanes sp. ATCC 53533]RSM41751.1 hypothetical protein DMB66_55575 [Actinoplanes sp. ATCC 53533]